MMHAQQDWRITEGPAIGLEPIFTLSNLQARANFYVTGGMSRSVSARLTTTALSIVESIGRPLADLCGDLTIFDSQPARSYPGLYIDHFGSIELGAHRGVLALVTPDRFAVHLYLPPEQFAALLPLLQSQPTAMLEMEIERTIGQGIEPEHKHFWNDRASPVIPFNEFRITT